MLLRMRETAVLAGLFAAHGIWSIADGAVLVPLLGYEQADGERGLDRFTAEERADATQTGEQALHANRHAAVRAVLVTDAYLRLDTGRTDALIVEAVQYGKAGHSIKMAVPYRPRTSPEGFAVDRPKFIGVTGIHVCACWLRFGSRTAGMGPAQTPWPDRAATAGLHAISAAVGSQVAFDG
jgi:hypothetical protein